MVKTEKTKRINLHNSLETIILNPENNPSALRITSRTTKDNYPNSRITCVVGKKNLDEDNKKYATIIQGGNTITSLIDAGLKNSKSEWCFIVMAGTYIRPYSLRKYEIFLKDKKQILYPVVNKKFIFDEATINGILIHRDAIEEVGKFGDDNWDIQLVKLLWADKAIDKGYKFIGLVGARLA